MTSRGQQPDLRAYLDAVEDLPGERVVRVARRVSARHELSAVTKLMETRGNPVLWFEDVDGLGIPVVCGVFATKRRISLALGATEQSAVAELQRRRTQLIEPARTREVPVQETRLTGDKANLAVLPIPVHAPEDAGRYITAAVCIVRDPDTGAHNAGIYRTMVKGPRLVTISADPSHDLGKVMKWGADHGVPIECAMVIGSHPALHLASQAKTPISTDAYSLMGSLLGEPVPVARAETVDLDVPAHAEIVIEGKILPGQREHEGPFGEFTYYYGESTAAVCEITAITHRPDPLYLDIHPAHTDHRCLWIFPGREARLLSMLQAVIPGVRGVHIPLDGAGMVAYISLHKHHDGDARRALTIALASDVYIKLAMVFDPDINIFDPGHVLWALALRFQADEDLMIIAGSRGYEEDPSSYSRSDRRLPGGLTTKTGFDVTAPKDKPYPPRADLLPSEYAGINVEDYLH